MTKKHPDPNVNNAKVANPFISVSINHHETDLKKTNGNRVAR